MLSIPQAIQTALQHHQAGRLPQAEALYRQVLQRQPRHADALHLLGLIAHQTGDDETAISLIGKAIAVNANVADFYNNRGEAYRALGRLDDAVTSYEKALRLRPDFVEACYNQALALQEQGKPEEAVIRYQRALALKPDLSLAHNNLGNILQKQGRLTEAVLHYERAIAITPGYAEAYSNLGSVWQAQGRLEEAVACHRRALALKPDYAGAYNNLGYALQDLGKLDEAVKCYEQALEYQLDFADAHNNLGNALGDQGRLNEAVTHYRQAMALKPDHAGAHSNLVFTLSYISDRDAESIFSEHREFARRHAQPLAVSILPHPNDRTVERRLRIGYVSGDLKRHSVAHFIEPVLAQHDRKSHEIFCYSNHTTVDEVTRRLQSYGGQWRAIAGLPDESVAQQIRDDGIDILVDLSGHTRNNRLLVFARKPAPVQVTWLGYPNTTGLPTMDCRLTDGFADPPGLTEHLHTEQLVRLPETFSCFRAPEGCPEVGKLPLLHQGYVTFGSFNNSAKITAQVLDLWGRILRSIPEARLVLKLNGISNRVMQESVVGRFAELGISQERLVFQDMIGSQINHLQRYHAIDIALDPFPYNGTTTNCDALWMGVPVITLAGRTHVSRVGTSQLSNLGLTELIAQTPEDYVQIAVKLAQDPERLQTLRTGLRARMTASPLMDAARFTRHLEAAYRQMWQRWCETGS